MTKINLPKNVVILMNILEKLGFEVFVVGGCVRDSLIGRTPKDWDMTTNATPDKVMEVFEKAGFNVVPTGLKHGTVTVMVDGEPFEITTYRIETKYSDGRHPDEVIFASSIEEDLSRRDFAMNAIAYSPSKGYIDPFGGIECIEKKLIKAVGNANDRYQEDALRMMRAVRFSSQLGFNIEKSTFEAIKTNADLIKNVSNERVKDELNKILLSDVPSKGIDNLQKTGLLARKLPALEKCVGFEQHNPNHDKDIYEHVLAVLDNSPKKLVTRLAALMHDIGKPNVFSIDEDGIGHFYNHANKSADKADKILRALKYDNKTIEDVVDIVRCHMDRDMQNKTLKKLLARMGIEKINDLFDLQIADLKGSSFRANDKTKIGTIERMRDKVLNFKEEKTPLSVKDLAIKGEDVMCVLQIKPSKQVGDILNKLMEIVLENPEMNNKETLIETMKKISA